MLRRASRFDLTTDKGDNLNTLVPTTAIRPDAMAKMYSRGTGELVSKKKICELTKSSKSRCWNRCKNLCLIDWIIPYIATRSTFVPYLKELLSDMTRILILNQTESVYKTNSNNYGKH